MVKKCANPHCGQPFRSARHGRIYSFLCLNGVRNYWLCFICCRRFRVVRAANGAVRLERIERPAA
jgi:hypothetical protein